MSVGRIQLEILEGTTVTDTRAFAGTLIEIGKLSKSDLQLVDENVSRRHAKIEIDAEGKVQLLDLESTNGTKLNGMRVAKAFLTDGDEIEIGLTRLRVRFDAVLKSAAQKNAPAARAAMSRDSFYRTQDDAKRGGRLALEGALLWEDAPVQADSFERQTVSPRLKGFLGFLWAFMPLEIGALGAVALALGFPTAALGIGCIAAGIFCHFLMDIDAWRHLVAESFDQMRRGEAVYVGETSGSRFFVPAETIGATEHPLIVPHKNGWALDLRLDHIHGDVLIDGKVISLDDPKAKAELLKDGLLPVTAGTKCRLRFGKFSMLLGYVSVPAKTSGASITASSIQEFAYLALSLILHFSVLILFVYMQPEDEIQIRRSKNQMIARLIQVESIKNKERKEKEKKEKEEDLPEKVDLKEDEEVVLEEDKAPTPTVTETEKLVESEKPKNAPRFNDPDKGPAVPMTEEQKKAKQDQTSRIAKATAERYIPTDMLANVTGRDLMAAKPGQALNIRVVAGGPGAAGEGQETAAGAMQQYAGADTGGGYAGMDFGGTGGVNGTDGGGGPGGGGLNVAGLDKGGTGVDASGRLKAAGLEKKELKAIVATAGDIITSGGLTKKIIQQYMDRQKGAIIACYKKEVQKTPNLEGKVVVAFTISPTGKVMAPGIKTSTLGNSAVESCIVSRLGLFRFPAPENAGAVKVTYPFLFRTR